MKTERHQKIVWLLKKQGFAKVVWLADRLDVTPETIRADLNDLSARNIIKRCHGGAMMDVADLGDIAQEEIIKCLTYDTWRFDHDRENESMSNTVCVLGSFNVDMISYVPRLPLPGESLLANRFLFSAGGKGNNQAQAASFAGTQVHFITKVGSDQFSDYAMDFISTSRVKTSTIYQTDQHRTGTASIFVAEEENGENIIAIYPGANMHISAQEVRMLEDKISEADIILLQLETNIEALNEIIAIANRNNIPVMLNPAPYSNIVGELIPTIDYLTPNQTEAGLISGVDITDIASAQAAALAIYHKGVGKVIITLGEQGSMAFDGSEFIHSPPFPAVVKNTAGAGDAFSGALAASLAKGVSLKYALCYASAFASLAVETSNASEMPEDDSVLRRIKQTAYTQTVTRYIGKSQEA